jgi:hypothetical protein
MSIEIYILAENLAAESSDSAYLHTDKKPGAGYHQNLSNLHTAIYKVDSFTGSIKLQGTLAIDPAESDWFDITNTAFGGSDDTEVTGDSAQFVSSTINRNFSGNFVWVRGAYNIQNGTVQQIAFSF